MNINTTSGMVYSIPDNTNTNFEIIKTDIETGTQTAQYSSVKECTVKLRGFVKALKPYTIAKDVIAVLPTGFRPSAIRIFSIVARSCDPGYQPIWINILPSGEIKVVGLATPSADCNVYIPLDGIFFEV